MDWKIDLVFIGLFKSWKEKRKCGLASTKMLPILCNVKPRVANEEKMVFMYKFKVRGKPRLSRFPPKKF